MVPDSDIHPDFNRGFHQKIGYVMRINKNSFTLIELIVVVIIIGILASVAMPMLGALNKKAIASEAITTLGMIRTCEKLYYVEHGAYCVPTDLVLAGYLKMSDIDGTYFSSYCYMYMSISVSNPAHTYFMCVPYKSNPDYSPKAQEVQSWPNNVYIAMDESGNIYSNISELGYSPSGDIDLGSVINTQ